MVNKLFTSVLSTPQMEDQCICHIPQYTCVRKSESDPIPVNAIYRVQGQPALTWICSCGELWPATGRTFRKHLGKCERADRYKNDDEFDVDTSD